MKLQSPNTPPTLTLENDEGFEVGFNAQGAAITSIKVPTPAGDVQAVLDYPDPELRSRDPYFLGVTAGRYANRLARAELGMNGAVHQLEPTPGMRGHTLHGGAIGFSHLTWATSQEPDERSVRFDLLSPDGDQGFPGMLEATVRYTLLDGWRLRLLFQATCDAPTVINLANHAYFNLNHDDAPATNHELWVNADRYTPVDTDLIPTGELASVEGTPFDLRSWKGISSILAEEHEQLGFAGGLDHNFVLNSVPEGLALAAALRSPASGLCLKLHTTQPGLQLYGGQHLGSPFVSGQGICLEAQRFPDAPNHSAFPSAILLPGDQYEQVSLYEFSLYD